VLHLGNEILISFTNRVLWLRVGELIFYEYIIYFIIYKTTAKTCNRWGFNI